MSSLLEAIRIVKDPRPERPPIRESDARGQLVTDERDNLHPDIVDSRLRDLAESLNRRHGGGESGFLAGAYRGQYRTLWETYQSTLTKLRTATADHFADECPELPDSAYYDAADNGAASLENPLW